MRKEGTGINGKDLTPQQWSDTCEGRDGREETVVERSSDCYCRAQRKSCLGQYGAPEQRLRIKRGLNWVGMDWF